MLRSTFLGYKTATSALKVNQNMMDVVGQNISNINTEGYTRQRLDINSVSFSTSNVKIGTSGVIIGQGVAAKGVSQFRDSFLDLRYRMEASKAGKEYIQLEALGDLEAVFDEISMEGLDSQFSKLLGQLHSLTSSPSDPVLEGVVRTSAQMLTQMFNNYAEQISTIRNQQLNYLENGAIVKVNQLTENIAKLNKQIKENNMSGNPSLELNDERNLLIDELSKYMDIEVTIEQISIGKDKTIDELSINMKLASNSKIKIIDDGEFAKFKATVPTGEIDVKVELEKNIDSALTNLDITNLIKGGQLEGYIEFINGKGEFASSTDSQAKGVLYYSNMLDALANKFAEVMNEANKTLDLDADNNVQYDEDGNIKYNDKPLFESRTNDVINAANIKISDAWASANSYITNTTKPTTGDSSGATDNLLKMISKFKPGEGSNEYMAGGTKLFNGTFQEFLSYTTTKLNLQVDDVQTSYDTYSSTQYQIDFARSSMSSVDLNEEGVNLLQYSKSYNAAARLMTTLDEMLDTLINRMGV